MKLVAIIFMLMLCVRKYSGKRGLVGKVAYKIPSQQDKIAKRGDLFRKKKRLS